MIGILWSRLTPAFTGPYHSRADRSSSHEQFLPWTSVQLPCQLSSVFDTSFDHSRRIIWGLTSLGGGKTMIGMLWSRLIPA